MFAYYGICLNNTKNFCRGLGFGAVDLVWFLFILHLLLFMKLTFSPFRVFLSLKAWSVLSDRQLMQITLQKPKINA